MKLTVTGVPDGQNLGEFFRLKALAEVCLQPVYSNLETCSWNLKIEKAFSGGEGFLGGPKDTNLEPVFGRLGTFM